MATFKSAVCCWKAKRIRVRKPSGDFSRHYYKYYYCYYYTIIFIHIIVIVIIAMNRNSFCACDSYIHFSDVTPLHLSASQGHFEICRLLLQFNADVQAKSGW